MKIPKSFFFDNTIHLFTPNRVKTTRMYTMSGIALGICLVSICTIVQGDGNCSTSKIESCNSAYMSSITQAVQDMAKVCSAVETFIDCLDKAFTDCNMDAGTTITEARKAINHYGCGAGSLVVNLVTLSLGLAFYKLF